MTRAAMQQALSALQGWSNYGSWVWPETALEQAKRNTTDAITALEAALAEQPAPSGWKLVPVEPTTEMAEAAGPGTFWIAEAKRAYRAMLAAAPTPPAPQPLTQMQIVKLWGHRSDGPDNHEIVSFARAVEREVLKRMGGAG